MATDYLRIVTIFVVMTSVIALMNQKFVCCSRFCRSRTKLMSAVPSQTSSFTVSSSDGSMKPIEKSKKVIKDHFPLSALPTLQDQQVIEQRQTGRPAHGIFGVENTRCKYGFPQAYAQYPVTRSISSGMIRLSCPHLVKAVDELEAEGGLDYFDAKLLEEPADGVLRTSFNETNQAWISIRKDTVSESDRKYVDTYLGTEGAENFMESGIIGCTIGKIQVKCLHAHIADDLMRGSNQIGAQALDRLKEKGVDNDLQVAPFLELKNV
jgi:hypothetical protein